MNDDFLTKIREEPDENFSRQLADKLSRQQPMPVNNWGRYVLSGALAVILLVVALSIVPAVRAKMEETWRKVGNIGLLISQEFPNSRGAKIVNPIQTSLDEARNLLPFNFELPGWIPEAYTLEDKVQLYVGEEKQPFSNEITLRWSDDDMTTAHLTLTISDRQKNWLVGTKSVLEVDLKDGLIAALIRGGWDRQQQDWNEEMDIYTLLWSDGDLSYELLGSDTDLLIRVARSLYD